MEFKTLITALESGEDFMLKRLFKYASEAEYTRYTSTKEEEWRMTLREPTKALIQFLKTHDQPDSIHVDEKFEENPTAKFGVLEARRHRKRGVKFVMFLGLTKLVRQVFIDLIYDTKMPNPERKQALAITHRFFDKFELGFCSEWVRYQEDELIKDLQLKNLEMTNEKNRYLTIFQSMAEPVFVVDNKMRIDEVNKTFAKFTGLSNRQIIGKNWTEVFDEQFINSCHLDKTISEGLEFTNIEAGLRINGENKELLIGGASLDDMSGKYSGAVCILQDITQRKQAEKKIKNQNIILEKAVQEKQQEMEILMERLLRQEKLATVGQISGSIAHELRNPLSVIKQSIFFLNRLHEKHNLESVGSKVRKHLELLDKEIDISNKVITDLLQITRMEPIKKEQINLRSIILEVLDRSSIKKNTQVNVNLKPEPFMIWADPLQMRQVILNLLSNATHDIIQKRVVTINSKLSKKNKKCLITVHDNGPGIPVENLNKVFEPLFTSKAKGIGLGLSICKQIIERHDGTITLNSTFGKSTTVSIELPYENGRRS